MSYQNSKSNSYCVGGRYHTSTSIIENDIKKTVQNLIIVKCIQWTRKKSMTVSDNTIKVGGLGKVFWERLCGGM